MSIRIGIFGYGNLGRGVESAIAQNSDMELAAVFTRRDPSAVKLRTAGVPCEMHILPYGPHGLGTAVTDPYNARWCEWLIAWLRAEFK